MKLIDKDAIPWDVEGVGEIPVITKEEIGEMPTVEAIPIQYILTTIREWNRYGYAESAEALEILVMNWDKENTE